MIKKKTFVEMKKFKIILLIAPLLFLSMSCGEDLLNKVDNSSINSASFYKTEADAVSSVNAAYAPLQNISLWGRRFHFMLDFTADEVDPTGNTQGPPQELLQHTFGPTGNEHIEWPWFMFYRSIAKTNITIRFVSQMDDALFETAGLKTRVIGEAKFLRALCYYYIAVLWNGGPLKLAENDTDLEVSTAKSSGSEILQQVIKDLTDAKAALPATYDGGNAGRATSGAAASLLGKVYLWQENYGQAETEFMSVINSGSYYLMGGPNDPAGEAETVLEAIAAMRRNHDFGEKNLGESIFEVQFAAGLGGLSWSSNSETGRQESTIRPHEYGVDGSSFYNCKPSQNPENLNVGSPLTDEYEGNGGTDIGDRDPRFEAFFFTQNDSIGTRGDYIDIYNTSGYAWKKYQSSEFVSQGSDNDTNHDVIRFADVVLMAAEAKIMGGKIGEGIALINQIRRRADPTGAILPDRPAGASQNEAMEYLMHERRVELCGEQVRRIDLVRWDRAGLIDITDYIPRFQVNKHDFFPIPQNEIDANEAMSTADQNPGY
jgi:starch-binding outer membrane protein, SusD/RagB family